MDHIRNQANISGSELPSTSVHAVTVPGAAAAWVDTVQHFGSGKIDLATILLPAIDLAENGYKKTFFLYIFIHSYQIFLVSLYRIFLLMV